MEQACLSRGSPGGLGSLLFLGVDHTQGFHDLANSSSRCTPSPQPLHPAEHVPSKTGDLHWPGYLRGTGLVHRVCSLSSVVESEGTEAALPTLLGAVLPTLLGYTVENPVRGGQDLRGSGALVGWLRLPMAKQVAGLPGRAGRQKATFCS